ncbi:MAG: serine O-acetyltransferase EpsC [Myxococcota bacterium]
MTDPTLDEILEDLRTHGAALLSDRRLPEPGLIEAMAEAHSLRVLSSVLAARLPEPARWQGILADVDLDQDELIEDLQCYRQRDFSAASYFDIACYSNGFYARLSHHLSHALLAAGERHCALLLQSVSTRVFGADLHPSAALGRRLFLDHGVGVVIGETATVGNDCSIFHGVTLGSTARHSGQRHPTVGNHVVLGAGATIIGAISIGDDAQIAAGAVVTFDVPSGGRVTSQGLLRETDAAR